MAFLNARNTDARYATFYNVSGNQYNEFRFNLKECFLKRLDPANMDASERTGCLENTRTDILTLIIDWASNPCATQRVLWLHGPAGSGKSTISTTLVDHFRRTKQLGAFLFFDRDVKERCSPALVARTIAFQLSLFDPEIADIVSATIESSPQTLTSPFSSQFQELLVEPLSSIESLHTESRIMLILDGLDECGTRKDRRALLEGLAEKSAHLPSRFRLIISSRPDFDIRLAFELQPHVVAVELDLTSAATKNDILEYFRHHMNIIQKKKRYLGTDWPGTANIRALAGRASGLFVWASIACNFVDAHDPPKRLSIVLQGSTASTAEAALDALYRTALEHAGVWDDEDFVADFRVLIGAMLVLRDPLTSTAIDGLVANPDGRPSIQTIEQLNCLLSSNPTVRFIHPSLVDFFTTRSRCDRDVWLFLPSSQERTLALLCLHRLEQALHHGMSQSADFVDIDGNPIHEDVTYACVFWVDHICMVKGNFPPILKLLKNFISQHVLHWFEALSLLKRFRLAMTLLDRLSEWIHSHHFPSERSLLELVRYWWRFSAEYEMCIQERPMQVYSEELLRGFQIIDVQEPLVSRAPTPNILDLVPLSQSPLDTLSFHNSSPSSPIAFPRLPDSLGSTPPVSRPGSPDFTRYGRRASRSSLSLLPRRTSSSSSMSRPVSPGLLDYPKSTSTVSLPEAPLLVAGRLSSTPSNHPSRRNSLNYPSVSRHQEKDRYQCSTMLTM